MRFVGGAVSIGFGLTSLVGILATAPVLASPGGARHGDLGRRAAVVEPLVLVAQDFTVPVNDVLDLTLGLPPGLDSTVLGQDGVAAEVVVGIYRDVSTRDEVRSAVAGDLDRIGDTFTVRLGASAAEPGVVWTTPTQLSLAIPTESIGDTDGALEVPFPGLYPVVIDISVDDEIVAEVLTFVHQEAENAALEDELSLAFLVGQTIEPTIDIDGNVVPTAAEIAELTKIADLLTAMDEAPALLGIDVVPPRAVLIEASTLGALQVADPELAARLVPLLERSELVATTKLPLDPSTAVRNTQQDLYTRWLVEGEDVLVTTATGADVDRTMYVIDGRTSTEAVLMRRNLGTRMLVLTPDIYLAAEGNIAGFTDTSQLPMVDLGGGDSIPAAIIDPHFAEMLDEPSTDPLATAVVMAAELLALREQFVDEGQNVSRHGMVVGASDAGVPDPAVIGELVRLLLGTNGVEVVEPSTIVATTSSQMFDGRELTVELPTTTGVDMSARLETIDEISIEYLGVTSMLPEDHPTLTDWARVVEALPSTALSDPEVDAMVEALRVSFDEYRNGVVGPEPFSFTLTGRDSSIPIGITNTTDTPLKVKIRLSSAKLTFPEGDQIITLPAFETLELRIPVEARSNGKAGVALEILMPATDEQVVPSVVLTARVNALTGLGQLVTGAALLVLATWWIRHWRISRRRRIAADHHHRHPAGNGVANGAANGHDEPKPGADQDSAEPPDGDGDELAPDAAASSLPPS